MAKKKIVKEKKEGMDPDQEKISQSIVKELENKIDYVYKAVARKENQAALSAFRNILNSKPDERLIKDHHSVLLEGVKVLPIEHVYALLDVVYSGQWSTYDFNFKIFNNELVAAIDLEVVDPCTGYKIMRSGVAAGRIEVKSLPDEKWKELSSGAKNELNDYILGINENKDPDAFKPLVGAVKSLALKNAAAMLGQIFGRNLNKRILVNPMEVAKTEYGHIENLTK